MFKELKYIISYELGKVLTYEQAVRRFKNSSEYNPTKEYTVLLEGKKNEKLFSIYQLVETD